MNRRQVFGVGAAAAGTVLVSGEGSAAAQEDDTAVPATPEQARRRIARVYRREVERAGGTWSSYISVAGEAAVAEGADTVVEAYSVNKIAVATAVLDKIDRGLLTLDQRVDVTEAIVIRDTDGIIPLDGAYPSSITLGHVLAMLLTVSDNTCVRLCGLVCPAAELNEILRAKGFVHTQVVPVANPNRFFLGKTTPAETHTLLQMLVGGTLLSAESSAYLLNVLRSLTAFTDGVRLDLSSAERLRVATKAGWFATGRNEAGVIFDAEGRPTVTYALFASGEYTGDPAANADNYSATHPALRARAKLGRTMMDAVARISAAPAARSFGAKAYHPVNGG
ncbi:MAG TPA: serine hydrolase [Actinophytocola sp.]|uniref:serine hydrolase n=1 Tax=Actinophytocola sp. TaxID=1872138 RepID=UPI002DDD9B7E|nr:serine hydrolase [Actinophytocola sp.]HEV2783989.1 serine hydrolase [Actinophytocola sp.]